MQDNAAIAEGDEGILLAAALLGVIEGLTEFIPVSSTGHLIVLVDFFRVQTPPGRVFEIAIQFGAIFAVCAVYWRRLATMAVGVFDKSEHRRYSLAILTAFLPAALLGVLAGDWIRESLFRPEVVACALIIGGVFIILAEARFKEPLVFRAEDISLPRALAIGAVQCLAFIPGVSRSGATILGALALGVERRAAAEFSFFVAIPTMLGAASYSLWKARNELSTDAYLMIAVGFVFAFIAALAVVSTVLNFISKHGFRPFAYYRIGLGALILLALAIGVQPA